MTNPSDLPPLPKRDPAGHKGTFGTVSVIGGCAGGAARDGKPRPLAMRMIGAPALAATTALRAGAGLSRLVMPEPILSAGMVLAPCSTGIAIPVGDDGLIVPHEAAAIIDEVARTSTCLAIGPGLGRGEGARAAALRAIQQEDAPVVVDADAINALAEMPQVSRDLHAAAILTPHPGEFRTLARGMGLKNDLGLAESREKAAEQMAQRLSCIIVLKGAGTVVSDGTRTWTNTSGHACLAVGGTGDVLTGVIAGLVAQFVASPGPPLPPALRAKVPARTDRPLDRFDAARLAVFAHGVAAERWARSRSASAGMLATELAGEIPRALEELRGQ